MLQLVLLLIETSRIDNISYLGLHNAVRGL